MNSNMKLRLDSVYKYKGIEFNNNEKLNRGRNPAELIRNHRTSLRWARRLHNKILYGVQLGRLQAFQDQRLDFWVEPKTEN